jgi:hypothetical protein
MNYMKKLFTLMLLTLVTAMGAWAGYIPTKRVTTFESGKMYMLYNTCVTNSDTRTGFIYWDGGMKKNTSFNPHQFATNNTAYLWKVTTGENNHIALQNVSTSKYIGFRLGENNTDPNNLYLYSWGTNQTKQSDVKSENEADPSTSTENANITFETNKVYIIGNGSDTFWNGNPTDIVTWSTGHPFAFYEVEECALDRADVGTYRFQTTALTTGASDYSIIKDGSGNVTISPNSGSYGATSGRFFGTLVVRINVPSTTTAGILCDLRPASDNVHAAQGLYMNTGCKLQTSWGYNGSISPRTDGNTLTTGEHTIIYTTGEQGAKVYVDGTQMLTDTGLKAGDVSYQAIYIPAAYAPYVTEVYFYSADVCAEYCSLISEECAKYMHASQITGTTAEVASDKTLILDANKNWTSLTGTGTVLQESAAITTNVAGNLPALTLKATAGTLTYTGTSLNGTTLDGVILGGSARINTSNTVNIKNLAGNNLNLNDDTNKCYAFVGDGTINFFGTCDLTKQSDRTTACNSANIGYGGSASVVFKEGANVTAGIVQNSSTLSSNASVTVESGATLTVSGSEHPDNNELLIYSINLTNNGTINLNAENRYSKVSALNGSGTINFASGAEITTPSVPSTSTLTGAGNVILTSFPTSTAPTLSSWTGTVQFPTTATSQDNLTALFNAWGNTGSTIKLNSVEGEFYQSETVNPTLNILSGATLSIGNASSDYTPELTGVGGAGTLNFASGATISVPSIPNTLTLTGAGVVKLTTFPTSSAPTVTSWTGIVQFPDKDSNTADITEIFNAWGNANSTINLNNLSGYFSNTTAPVQPTLNILENKTLTITNGFSDNPPVLSKLTGKGNINLSWTGWRDNFNLTIQKLTGFEGTLTTATAPINVEKLYLSAAPDADALLIKTSGTVALEKLYIGLEETTAYSWNTTTVEGVTGIYVASVDMVQLARESAVNIVTPYYDFIGTGVGKYTISLGDDKYNSIEDFLAALDAWSTVDDYKEPKVTINQPTSGFYRFHIDNKYMCGIAGNDNVRTATETNNDASTIFYLNEDNYLISYLDGYGFNYGYCKAISPGIFNKFDFSKSTLLTKYNIHSNAGTGDSEWSDRNITINTSNNKLAEGQGTWAIEPVTSLPVTLKASALGYATFCCPVPVKIPSGVEAFVSKIEDNTIKLFRIENFKDASDNVVIPANTAVMLHNKNFSSTDETFSFEIAEYSGDGITDNGFYGTIAAESMVASDTYYSLRTWKVNDVPTKVGFATKTSGSLAGFKAWIHEEGQSARNFTIVFDSDSDPTGIIEALGLQNDNVEIYDLNGRKLSSYKRGINIVNGKKVMVQ